MVMGADPEGIQILSTLTMHRFSQREEERRMMYLRLYYLIEL